jgi:sulfopyruvate decarboxylase subunit alpha
MEARDFWGTLKARGFTFFSGVPDSTFKAAYNTMVDDPEIRYVPAVREDVALGVASAAYFSGRRGGIIMQNSGIGNIINPLTSFSLMYKIPVLLIIGWRGYGGPNSDAPEHWIMGAKTTDFLELLDIPFAILDPGSFEATLHQLVGTIEERSVPGALLVRKGVIK